MKQIIQITRLSEDALIDLLYNLWSWVIGLILLMKDKIICY